MKIIKDRVNESKPINEKIENEERASILADYLEIDVSEVKEPTWDWQEYETPEGDFYVFTEEEAREAAEESVRNFIDDVGITGFTENFQDWIFNNAIDKDWFEEALREMQSSYAYDIKDEDDDEFGNRLIRELYEEGIITDNEFGEDEEGNVDYTKFEYDEDDYIDEYVDLLVDNSGDPVEYYRDNFGDRDFNAVVIQNNLYDEDMIIDEVISWDGVAHQLATYDGDEIELPNGLFAYRIN